MNYTSWSRFFTAFEVFFTILFRIMINYMPRSRIKHILTDLLDIKLFFSFDPNRDLRIYRFLTSEIKVVI